MSLILCAFKYQEAYATGHCFPAPRCLDHRALPILSFLLNNSLLTLQTNLCISEDNVLFLSGSHVHQGGIVSAAASRVDISGTGDNSWIELIDLSNMKVIPKQVRPLEKQDSRETRRMWDPVTSRLIKKEYSEATREKVVIEQRQRDEAAERKKKGTEYVYSIPQ